MSLGILRCPANRLLEGAPRTVNRLDVKRVEVGLPKHEGAVRRDQVFKRSRRDFALGALDRHDETESMTTQRFDEDNALALCLERPADAPDGLSEGVLVDRGAAPRRFDERVNGDDVA